MCASFITLVIWVLLFDIDLRYLNEIGATLSIEFNINQYNPFNEVTHQPTSS